MTKEEFLSKCTAVYHCLEYVQGMAYGMRHTITKEGGIEGVTDITEERKIVRALDRTLDSAREAEFDLTRIYELREQEEIS